MSSFSASLSCTCSVMAEELRKEVAANSVNTEYYHKIKEWIASEFPHISTKLSYNETLTQLTQDAHAYGVVYLTSIKEKTGVPR